MNDKEEFDPIQCKEDPNTCGKSQIIYKNTKFEMIICWKTRKGAKCYKSP